MQKIWRIYDAGCLLLCRRQVGTEILGLRKIPAHWSISRFKVAQINRDWHGYNSYNLVGTRTIKVQCKIMSYFPSLDLENVTLTHFRIMFDIDCKFSL